MMVWARIAPWDVADAKAEVYHPDPGFNPGCLHGFSLGAGVRMTAF